VVTENLTRRNLDLGSLGARVVGFVARQVQRAPAEVATTLAAHGDADTWPFDSHTTDPLGAVLLAGSGDTRQFVDARVEVTGALVGWNLSSVHSGPDSQASGKGDYATVTLRRALGQLAFDLGICLVLITLPILALFVAIEMLRGRKQFLPPFATWYAGMLFAVVPLRKFLLGTPPPGAWVDQAIVLWVLIGLAAAMVIYIVCWWNSPTSVGRTAPGSDGKTGTMILRGMAHLTPKPVAAEQLRLLGCGRSRRQPRVAGVSRPYRVCKPIASERISICRAPWVVPSF
jgi:hypothetical protein